jgi:hypothetical protein
LGFDWHSSGLTTTVCAAIKEGIKSAEGDFGLFVAGGKGKTSRKTPLEIEDIGLRYGIDADRLIYASKMSAKIDNTAIQDGYQLYHHMFFFDREGNWSVVQQGMNEESGYARRYHWHSKAFTNFVEEPHTAICCDKKSSTLNMVAMSSSEGREVSTCLAKENPEKVIKEIKRLKNLNMPERHKIFLSDIKEENLKKVLLKTYEESPQNYEALLAIRGVGPKTIRALALISQLIYESSISWEDPAKFSFAHGGKDGYPFPINKEDYDRSINILQKALYRAKIGDKEKIKALKRLSRLIAIK